MQNKILKSWKHVNTFTAHFSPMDNSGTSWNTSQQVYIKVLPSYDWLPSVLDSQFLKFIS